MDPKEALLVLLICACGMATLGYFLEGWEGAKQGLITVATIPVVTGAGGGGALLFHLAKDMKVRWRRFAARLICAALVFSAIAIALAVFKSVPVDCITPNCRYD